MTTRAVKYLTQNAALWLICMAIAALTVFTSKLAFGADAAAPAIANTPVAVKSAEVAFLGSSDGPAGIGTVTLDGKKCATTAELTKTGDLISGKITVDLMTCTMGEKDRDAHMKEDFAKAGASKAVCEIKDLPSKGQGTAACEKMTVGKEAKTQAFTYVWNGSSLEAKIDFKLSDYNIPRRTYLGATVHDPVTVTAKLAL